MTHEKKEMKPERGFQGASIDEAGTSFAGMGSKQTKPELLLHSCCGPCSTSVIERLMPDYKITVFYFNPCITDRDEYEKRKETQKFFIESFNRETPCIGKVKFIEGDYNPESYLENVKGHEDAPEGGSRCELCFKQRLEETAKKAKSLDMDCFTTTLTVSPHKDYKLISRIGNELSEKYGIEFVDIDFKKKAGFQRSIQLAKKHNLYRQDYCGCKFSKR